MGQAMHNWNKYWKVVLNSDSGEDGKSARIRYEKYMREIKMEIETVEREEKEKIKNGHENVGLNDSSNSDRDEF